LPSRGSDSRRRRFCLKSRPMGIQETAMSHVSDFERSSTPPIDFATLAIAIVVVIGVAVLQLL